MTVRAFAPASVGNFGVGFDVLGAAVAPVDGSLWGDIVEVDIGPGEGVTLDLTGPFAHELPSDPTQNVVSTSWSLFRRRILSAAPGHCHVHVRLHKGLPTASGLGSSASSIVAALVAFNAAYGDRASQSELLTMAGEIEVGGVRTEAVGRDVVFDAIMAAAGFAPVGVPGEACCSAAPSASGCCGSVPDAGAAPLTVTLVTAPGCG